MADPDQARGSSFEVMERLAAGLSGEIRGALQSPAAARLEGLRVQGLEVALPLRYGALSDGEVGERVRRWKEELAAFLGVPVEQVPENTSINALVKERCRELALPAEQVRRWVAHQYAYTSFLYLIASTAGARDGTLGVSTCVVDFGPLVLLAVPAEVLTEAALEWQQRLPDRIALIAGLAGGWVGYLPHAGNFAEPRASERYETVSTLFAPEAAQVLLEEAARRLS